jgi:branched-chain amino acid transport system substrate-binding protein
MARTASTMTRRALAVTILAALLVAAGGAAQAAGTQFIPIFTGREIAGPAGVSMPAGMVDYLNMLNRRDGGIDGVRLSWEECETAFDDQRGVQCFERIKNRAGDAAALVMPLSSGISYALTERSRQERIPMLMIGYGRADASDGRVFPYAFPMVTNLLSQAAAQIRFIGLSEGGMKRLRGKRIVHLYLDIPTGQEARQLLELSAQELGFELIDLAVPLPGVDQQAPWERIRRLAPDWVLLAGPGPMTPAALRAAAGVGFPARRIIGFGLSGAEQDVLPAGEAAIGYIAVALNPSGTNFAVIREIVKHVHARAGDDGAELPRDIGSAYYNRGVIQGILVAEAIRTAHRRFGARPLSGEELRWGLERLVLDEARLARLGALELLQPLSISCDDHEGGGAVKFQQWLGTRWNVISDWIAGDPALVRQLVEAAAARYARERGIAPRECAKER